MNKRQTKILELLTQNKKIEVTKLSELLGVSQVTIRKDLDALSESGMLIREHGYATLNKSDDMNIRLAYHYEQKQQVAKKAVESIQHGETIMIESGSCCALVALEIAKTKKDVTLITNSAFIADYIRKHTSIKIILLGGEYQHESQVMVGPMMRKCAEAFFICRKISRCYVDAAHGGDRPYIRQIHRRQESPADGQSLMQYRWGCVHLHRS